MASFGCNKTKKITSHHKIKLTSPIKLNVKKTKIMNTNLNHRPGRTTARESKKIITLCALLLTFALSSFTRPNDKISGPVNSSFKKEFRNARIISYEVSPKYTKLNFSMEGLILSAFYSDKGELLAVTRNILTTQLPFNLMLGIKEKYKDYWVTGLFEMRGKEDNAYYLTIENASSKLALRSVDNFTWEI